MSRIFKFISKAAVKEGHPFLVRCTCDASLIATGDGIAIACETCGREIVPKVVEDAESVSVRDEESGQWKSYPVQQYRGARAPWTPRVGDIVGKSPGPERWRIERIDGRFAVIKLLGNRNDTGVPVELNYRETVPLSVLFYNPD